MAVAIAELQEPLELDDFLSFPDSSERLEIITGDLVATPAPRPEHEELSQALNFVFESIVRPKRLGKVYTAPVGVCLSPHDIVQPDLFFLSSAKRAAVSGEVVNGEPDVIAEILSLATRRLDIVRKKALYRVAGVREYWIIDPEKRDTLVSSLIDGHYVLEPNTDGVARSRVIPGVEIDIQATFSDVWWSE